MTACNQLILWANWERPNPPFAHTVAAKSIIRGVSALPQRRRCSTRLHMQRFSTVTHVTALVFQPLCQSEYLLTHTAPPATRILGCVPWGSCCISWASEHCRLPAAVIERTSWNPLSKHLELGMIKSESEIEHRERAAS